MSGIDIFLAVVGGGLGAEGVRWLIGRRRAGVDMDTTIASANRLLKGDVAELHKLLRESEGRATLAETTLAARGVELAVLRRRVSHLETGLPPALLGLALEEMSDSVRAVLDELAPRCVACRNVGGLVISSPGDQGKLVWVSASFAETLGYGLEEVLQLGWRGLIHPEDLGETLAAEATAWDEPVMVVNRYRHKEGGWVRLRWLATHYLGVRVALAVARAERREVA